MGKLALYLGIGMAIVAASCRNYRYVEGRTYPIRFTADSTVFADPEAGVQTIEYRELLGLLPSSKTLELYPDRVLSGALARPTFVRKEKDVFLLYPGEEASIRYDGTHYRLTLTNGDAKRDSELLVLNRFRDLEKWPGIPVLFGIDLPAILDMEQKQVGRIERAQTRADFLFDSLFTACGASDKFRRLASDFVAHRYDISMLLLYEVYRDTLSAHGLYRQRLKSLLPGLNRIRRLEELDPNTQLYLNQFYSDLFPYAGIWNLRDESGFRDRFDSVAANFSGIARDYLLTRIMYRAITRKIAIPAAYEKRYRRYNDCREYRQIITRTRRKLKNESAEDRLPQNELLLVDGQTKTTFEDLLAQYKGKYVVVDLWSSWCLPCLEETPLLQQMAKKYGQDKMAFLSISIDKDLVSWHKALYRLQSDSTTNYLLLNEERSALVQQIRLTTIPRYLIYDRQGQLINADAPVPSDPALTRLIENYLKD